MDCTLATILIVEDHTSTRQFLADNLNADGYEILEAASADEGQRLLASAYPDLAILDLELPDRDGLELLRVIRGSDRVASRIDPDLPLLVVTGRDTELEAVRAFAGGCDDYVRKPYSYVELRARVAALLRRGEHRPRGARIRVGRLELDAGARQVWIDGQQVHLSTKEFGLLRMLAADPGRVFTREELLRSVWGFQTLGNTRTLDSHASRLRRKLAVNGASFIVNAWGIGYRLTDVGP